jgi:hypothetical protein
MGTGYVVGTGRVPQLGMTARFGGHLSSLLAEADSLLHLLSSFGYNQQMPILILSIVLYSWTF